MPSLGARLRRLRLSLGMKQSHLAELAGVAQTTVSRWESGVVHPDPQVLDRLTRELTGDADRVADRALLRLVQMASRPVHLVDDLGHRLLAASPAREREWGVSAARLLGASLWPYATDEIRVAEAEWLEAGPSAVVTTKAGTHGRLRIRAGTMTWERMHLASGVAVRLGTSIATDA